MNANSRTGRLAAARTRQAGRSTPLAYDDSVEILPTAVPETNRPVDCIGRGHKQQHVNGQRDQPARDGDPAEPGKRVDVAALDGTLLRSAHRLRNGGHVIFTRIGMLRWRGICCI
jgi:hypothetical protein